MIQKLEIFIPVKYNRNNVLLITTGLKGMYYGLILVDWFEERDVGYQIVKTCFVHL